MRCEICSTLSPSTLICNDPPTTFHPEFRAFELSAKQGCELCVVLLWNLQKWRWGRDERLVFYAELIELEGPLLLQWRTTSIIREGRPVSDLVLQNSKGKRLGNTILHETPVGRKESTTSPFSSRIELIQQWRRTCSQTHSKCGMKTRTAEEPLRHPARLLDLMPSDAPSGLRLVPFEGTMSSYATLSYSWGNKPHGMTTNSSNYADRLFDIPVEAMPKTFADSIALCRDLRIRYLWIDALCIIQGNHTDWQTEAAIMGDIYVNSALTIAASGAGDSSIGLYPSMEPFNLAPKPCSLFPDSFPINRHLEIEPPEWVASVTEAPLQQRAWVLQERFLASQSLHCTQYGLFWECSTLTASDFAPTGIPLAGHALLGSDFTLKHDAPTPLTTPSQRKAIKLAWRSIRDDYSQRHLTVATDRLPAISSLASRIAAATHDTYVAGLWASTLAEELLWHGIHRLAGHRTRPTAAAEKDAAGSATVETYVAPSWSWASVVGWTTPGSVSPSYRVVARVLGWAVEPVFAGNPYGQVRPGAWVRIKAQLRRGVSARPTTTEADDELPPYYELTSVSAAEGVSASAVHSIVHFDVGTETEETYPEFSVALISQAKTRDGVANDVAVADAAPEVKDRSIKADGLVLVPMSSRGKRAGAGEEDQLADGSEIRWKRIGQVTIYDSNFFVGCEEAELVVE